MSLRMSLIQPFATTTPQPARPFYDPFSGTTRVSWCQKRTSGLMVQGKITRGRHTDHAAGRHSIRTNQCLLPHTLKPVLIALFAVLLFPDAFYWVFFSSLGYLKFKK